MLVPNQTIEAIIEGRDIREQTMVDDYATAIEDAIQALIYKDADYPKVNAIILQIPKDLSIYTDQSVVNLKSVLTSIDYSLNITKQSQVDAYAIAVEKAIQGLQKKEIIHKPDTGDSTTIYQLYGLFILSGVMILNRKVRSRSKE